MAQFLESIKRMIMGKPVFEDENKEDVPNQSITSSIPEATEPAIHKNQPETFPVVHVRRITTHLDGDNIQIYAHIQNTWEQEIMLDKIRLLDTTHELDTFLHGGEERDFLVYKGPKLQREVHEAQLDYKIAASGDYFRAMHDARFTYRPEDKTYTLIELQLHQPIHDIYE